MLWCLHACNPTRRGRLWSCSAAEAWTEWWLINNSTSRYFYKSVSSVVPCSKLLETFADSGTRLTTHMTPCNFMPSCICIATHCLLTYSSFQHSLLHLPFCAPTHLHIYWAASHQLMQSLTWSARCASTHTPLVTVCRGWGGHAWTVGTA